MYHRSSSHRTCTSLPSLIAGLFLLAVFACLQFSVSDWCITSNCFVSSGTKKDLYFGNGRSMSSVVTSWSLYESVDASVIFFDSSSISICTVAQVGLMLSFAQNLATSMRRCAGMVIFILECDCLEGDK